MPRPHRCDDRCVVIAKLRQSGLKYATIGKRLGLTKQRVGQIGQSHSMRGRAPLRVREGEAWCVTCHRELDPRIPDSKLLAAEECCGWCGRRWDGGLMIDLTGMLEALTQAGAQR